MLDRRYLTRVALYIHSSAIVYSVITLREGEPQSPARSIFAPTTGSHSDIRRRRDAADSLNLLRDPGLDLCADVFSTKTI